MACSPLRILAPAILLSFVAASQPALAQISFTNSGQVGSSSPISGVLTDAEGDSIGYTISTTGPLFFGWNGDAASELGGVQENFGQIDGTFDWIFTMAFDSPIESLTLSQTPFYSTGTNAGGSLMVMSDAANASANAGTQGLGSDSLSNLNGVVVAGGDVSATLATTRNDEDDWFVNLENVQTVTVRYQPTATAPAVVGSEWLTFSDANVVAIPEPSTLVGLGCLLATVTLRRRRTK
jgi:hypothetical protein